EPRPDLSQQIVGERRLKGFRPCRKLPFIFTALAAADGVWKSRKRPSEYYRLNIFCKNIQSVILPFPKKQKKLPPPACGDRRGHGVSFWCEEESCSTATVAAPFRVLIEYPIVAKKIL
ncbi:MAG: hypothetical protein ACI4KN_04735, partial [Gemmiger sp.]